MANENESTMKWKVDITDLKSAMQEAKRAINQANAEFKTATAGMDKWSKSTEGLEAKLGQLNKLLPAQKRQLDVLEESYAQTVKTMGANSSAAADLKIKIEEQKAAIVKTETSIDKYTGQLAEMQAAENSLTNTVKTQEQQLKSLKTAYVDAVGQYGENSEEAKALASQISSLSDELVENKKTLQDASSAADKLDHSLEDVEDDAKKANDGFTVLKGTIANLAAQGITALFNGCKRLGSELINVGKQAYEAYSEFEQLTGGVETLFGDSADKVKQYAENAYKTAGMSANEYMETVTSFSAALLQGLNGDTAKAAQIADLAITDMSDNANKMGTSMESIQNAYQGFAKQNYTMLDNLKLGYGGTKEEMARLVKESGILGKAGEDLTAKNLDQKVSYDQIIQAIHKVQTNMGITGTTAKEASSTIEGSTKSMKASWKNLMVAIADDNADIDKSIRLFTKSAETTLSNAVPRIKKIVKGLFEASKKMIKQYMPEFYNNVVPYLKKLYDTVKTVCDFIVRNFKTIAPIVMTAVAAFTALNAALAISKTITAVSAAMGALSAGVGLATKAQVGFNAALAANPIGAVLTAVVALTAAMVTFFKSGKQIVSTTYEMSDALKEQREKVEETTKSWNDLKEAQQKQVDASMTELSYYESLKKELQTIVDKNGKIKKGYEQRASFITGQLSEATGKEIKVVKGVIKEYGNLMDTIDKVMEKKKAEILLSSQEALYKEAITNQTQALKDYAKYRDDYHNKTWEIHEDEKKIAEIKKKLSGSITQAEREELGKQWLTIESNLENKRKEKDELEKNYKAQEKLLEEYAYNIGQYETNMQLAHEGKYREMSKVTWDYFKDYQNASDSQKQMLEDTIKTEETNLELLKKLKAKSGSDIYDQQIKQAEDSLEQHKKDLKKYNSATEKANDDAEIIWKDGLDKQLTAITGKKIEFKDAGDGNVQMYVDGVKQGEPKSKEEMAKLVTNSIKEITKQTPDAKKAGEDLIDGVNNGVANEKKQSGVFSTIKNFGSKLLKKLKDSLKEKSPSKATDEMGQFLLEGLSNGFKKKENETLSEVASFGKSVLDTLNSELEEGASLTGVKESLTSELNSLKGSVAIQSSALNNGGLAAAGSYSSETKNQTINFYQTNNSPKAIDGMTLYRETNNLLFSAKVRLGNV